MTTSSIFTSQGKRLEISQCCFQEKESRVSGEERESLVLYTAFRFQSHREEGGREGVRHYLENGRQGSFFLGQSTLNTVDIWKQSDGLCQF